jgi:hypothetical protein
MSLVGAGHLHMQDCRGHFFLQVHSLDRRIPGFDETHDCHGAVVTLSGRLLAFSPKLVVISGCLRT